MKKVMSETRLRVAQRCRSKTPGSALRLAIPCFTLLFTAVVYSQEVTFKEVSDGPDTPTQDYAVQSNAAQSNAVQNPATSSELYDRYSTQRALYVELKQQVVDGNFLEARRQRDLLTGYPLEYYFDYLVLRHQITRHNNPLQLQDTVADYYRRYNDGRLHRRLLGVMKNRLVALGHWKSYALIAGLDNAPLHPCDDLLAKVKNGSLERADTASILLWATPAKHTKNCDQAFAKLVQNPSDVSTRELWQRTVALLLQGDNFEINKLLPFFGQRDRKTVRTWVEGLDDPEAALRSPATQGETPHHRKVVTFLLRRWARNDLVAASEFWQANGQSFGFSSEEVAAVGSKYAVLAAKRRMPESADLLAAVASDPAVRYWRVRIALLEQDWKRALQALELLTTAEKQSNRWQYWRARALTELGRAPEADPIYRELSEQFDYFGFLAADQLGVPYNIVLDAPQANTKALQELANHPDIVRAMEFFFTGTGWEGRRLWNAVLESKEKEHYVAAAQLAMSVNWVDRALASMELSEEKKALDVLFPTPYQSSVARLADHHSVASELIYGVMKQESAFIPDIKSSAGAIGLMQLMLPTARDMGRKLGVNVPGWKLTNSELNLRLGVRYLRHVLDRFGKNTVLATAAYNAGPHRVSQWVTDRTIPADIWIETIPFDETRRYVRAVLFNTTVSEWRIQKGKLTRLRQRMPDVLPLG